MLAVVSKSDTLYESLWEELTKLAPGERFPSMREIMKRYEVSQLTVDKAVSKLREDGYLRQITGKGLFATDRVKRFNQSIKPTFMLAVPQWISSDIDLLETTVNTMREEFSDYRLLVYRFHPAESFPQELPLLEENVEGVILLPTSTDKSVNDLKRMADYPVPLVVLGWHLDSFGICSVGADDTYAGHMAAHYLAGKGHRQIGVLLSEPHNQVIMERVKAIMDYCELHGLEATLIDCEVKSGEMATDKTYRKFMQVISDGFDFTALLGICGESMQGAVNACLNRGVSIPDQLSMIAIGGDKIAETFHPPLNTIGIRFDEQVHTALEILRNRNPMRHLGGYDYVRPIIIEHGSVRTI